MKGCGVKVGTYMGIRGYRCVYVDIYGYLQFQQWYQHHQGSKMIKRRSWSFKIHSSTLPHPSLPPTLLTQQPPEELIGIGEKLGARIVLL